MLSKQRGAYGASAQLGLQFAVDWARRTVKRSQQGLPVGRGQLKDAKAVLARASDGASAVGRKGGAI